MIDKLNIGQKFIITYRPMTHNGVARPKLKNGKDTRLNNWRFLLLIFSKDDLNCYINIFFYWYLTKILLIIVNAKKFITYKSFFLYLFILLNIKFIFIINFNNIFLLKLYLGV